MASTGPIEFGTYSDDSAVGTEAWSNPGNAGVSDDSRATVSLTETQSHYLKCIFSDWAEPPDDADTINGIEISIERSTDGGGGVVVDTIARLVKVGSVVGDNKAIGIAWTGTDTVDTYGGAADLWGTTWTAAEVKDADFGFVISVQENLGLTTVARIDLITAKLYYTPAAGGGPRVTHRRISNLRRM